MELQTRLEILIQHLELLIYATQQTDQLRGVEVGSTLILIHKEIQEIQQQINELEQRYTQQG